MNQSQCTDMNDWDFSLSLTQLWDLKMHMPFEMIEWMHTQWISLLPGVNWGCEFDSNTWIFSQFIERLKWFLLKEEHISKCQFTRKGNDLSTFVSGKKILLIFNLKKKGEKREEMTCPPHKRDVIQMELKLISIAHSIKNFTLPNSDCRGKGMSEARGDLSTHQKELPINDIDQFQPKFNPKFIVHQIWFKLNDWATQRMCWLWSWDFSHRRGGTYKKVINPLAFFLMVQKWTNLVHTFLSLLRRS